MFGGILNGVCVPSKNKQKKKAKKVNVFSLVDGLSIISDLLSKAGRLCTFCFAATLRLRLY